MSASDHSPSSDRPRCSGARSHDRHLSRAAAPRLARWDAKLRERGGDEVERQTGSDGSFIATRTAGPIARKVPKSRVELPNSCPGERFFRSSYGAINDLEGLRNDGSHLSRRG